ncbi:hypothetical protein A0257_04710 [Hymenobacter psoromatis]|nr:hypothetical protein A0257_04710 [Hymenobacter psoromatis]
MQLLLLEDIRRFLEEEFVGVEPEFVDGLLLNSFCLSTFEIQRVEHLLDMGELPASFTDLIQTYDFGNFSLFNAEFGVGCTGSLDWLLAHNDLTQFGFESFLAEAHQLGLVLIANGDPFAFFMQVRTGIITAMTSEQSFATLLPVAGSFPHFIQGLGTAYQALRRKQLPGFRELARQEFGEAAYPFWHELTL